MAADRNARRCAQHPRPKCTSSKAPSPLDTYRRYQMASRDPPATNPCRLPHSKIKQCQSPFPFQSPRVQWWRKRGPKPVRPEARSAAGAAPVALLPGTVSPCGDECCQESRGIAGGAVPLMFTVEGKPALRVGLLRGLWALEPPPLSSRTLACSSRRSSCFFLSAMLPSY